MEMTVAEMLNLPLFRDMMVVAGKSGLHKRRIKTVTVVDALDSTQWIRGGEFVISSGYIFKDNPSFLSQFLVEFENSGISALGIKLGRFLGEFPPEVIRIADDLEIPLVHIPNHYAFSDVIDPVLSNVINRQAERLKFSETVNRSFFELITNGGEVDEVLAHLRKFLRCDLAFVDVVFGENHICGNDPVFRRKLEMNSLRDLLAKVPNESIKISDKMYGYLFVDSEISHLSEEDWEIPVTHAKTALLLCLQKRLAKTEAERRYRDEFVQDILYKNLRHEKEVWNRARIFNWDLKGSHRIVILDIDNYKHHFEDNRINESAPLLEKVKQRIYNISITLMRSRFKDVPYTAMSDFLCFIIPTGDSSQEQQKKELTSLLASIQKEIQTKTHFTVTVGIGNERDNIFECHESFIEAKKALEMIRINCGPGHLVFWDELGVYKLLGNLCQTKEAEVFLNEYIGSLLEYDKRKNGGLVKTLEALIRNNWEMKVTAGELSIHYNTLKYRLKRISEMTGFDIQNSEKRLDFALSLKLYQMKNL